MAFSTPWVGVKRIAFVPLFRTVVDPPDPPDQIPPNWSDAILQRVLYDPRAGAGGADRSLRAFLRAASSGRADIEPLVMPMETIDRHHVEADDLDGRLGGQLRDMGMDGAMLVMLGGAGAGTTSAGGYWSRVVMAEPNGIWMHELIHNITGFMDLYHFDSDVDPKERAIGVFDVMSDSPLTHPTTFTKLEMGWADPATVPLHFGASTMHRLQHVSLAQPPAAGRLAAVRVGADFPYVMVESRQMTDQFEGGMPTEAGISSQGVIAYRIQTRNPTVQDREGNKKPLFLMTLTAAKVGEAVALDNGTTLRVTAALPDGFEIWIDDPDQHHLDRTAQTGARKASSPPCALPLDAQGIDNIAYRDTSGHMNEIWRSTGGQGTTDLTANASAPGGKGTPFTYFDPAGNQVVLIFRGSDDHVRSLYWMFGAVGHDLLTASAPKTAGNPAGWFSKHDGVHHVTYRTSNGHLQELWWQGQGGVGNGDLTALANAVPAAGDPWPYYDPVRATNIVTFRGTDNRIRSLYWAAGPIGQDDLSGTAGTPAAAGDPFAWFTGADQSHHVVYRAANGHVYELRWFDLAPVHGRDLTALSGAPAASGDVSGGYNRHDNTHHVVYRSSNGDLHELWYFLGTDEVGHVNLTAAYGGPKAADKPVYFSTERAPHQHVAYRTSDQHIHEYIW